MAPPESMLTNRREPSARLRVVPRDLLLLASFFCVTLVVYRPVLRGWFIADDFRWLEISTLQDVLRSFVAPWGHGASYRPIPRLTFLFDFWIFGYSFPGWALTNFFLHSLNCLLLYHLTADYFSSHVEPLCITWLFCLSPVAHENVAWISGRTHLLAALFVLLSLLVLNRQLSRRRNSFGLAAGFFFLGLLSYEAAACTLLFVAIVLLWGRHAYNLTAFSVIRIMTLFFAVFGLYLLVRAMALYGATVPFYQERTILSEALQRHILTVFTIIAYWSGLGLPILAAAVIGILLRPVKMLIAALLGLTVVVIGLLPFAMLPTISYRFLYIAQIGIMLFVGLTVAGLVRESTRVTRAAGYALFVMALVIPTRQLGSFTREWAEAGQVAWGTAQQIKRLYPRQPAGTNFLVFGAPVTYHSVPLFISYFDSTVRFTYDHYRAFNGVVLNSWELNSKPHLVGSIRGQVAHTGAACPPLAHVAAPSFEGLSLADIQTLILDCPAKYFVFNKKTLQVTETSRDAWLSLFHAHPNMVFLP